MLLIFLDPSSTAQNFDQCGAAGKVMGSINLLGRRNVTRLLDIKTFIWMKMESRNFGSMVTQQRPCGL